jgi:hypothetical protein
MENAVSQHFRLFEKNRAKALAVGLVIGAVS